MLLQFLFIFENKRKSGTQKNKISSLATNLEHNKRLLISDLKILSKAIFYCMFSFISLSSSILNWALKLSIICFSKWFAPFLKMPKSDIKTFLSYNFSATFHVDLKTCAVLFLSAKLFVNWNKMKWPIYFFHFRETRLSSNQSWT